MEKLQEKELENLLVDEDINNFLKKKGVIVKLKVKGGRNRYNVSSKLYGVKDSLLEDNTKDFMNDHMTSGTISFVPKHKQKEFLAIEAKARKRIRELAIGYDQSYIPITYYQELMEFLEECETEFNTIKISLVNSYEDMKTRFIADVKMALVELNAQDAKEEMTAIFEKIPTKDRFEESMQFSINISTFPTLENIDMLPARVQEKLASSQDSHSTNLITDMITSLLNDTFVTLSSVIYSGKRNGGKVQHRSVSGVKNQIQRMKKGNVVGNAKLIEIQSEIEGMLLEEDGIIEDSERILANIFHYATEINIDDSLDMRLCPFSKKELVDIYNMYQ